jgi:hypothetical protein
MKKEIFKLRNGLAVMYIPRTLSMFKIITKNIEINKLRAQGHDIQAGHGCDERIVLVPGMLAGTRDLIKMEGGAYGPGYDVVGYKRRFKV